MWAVVNPPSKGDSPKATSRVVSANPGALLRFFFSKGQMNYCSGSEDGFVSVDEATCRRSA